MFFPTDPILLIDMSKRHGHGSYVDVAMNALFSSKSPSQYRNHTPCSTYLFFFELQLLNTMFSMPSVKACDTPDLI